MSSTMYLNSTCDTFMGIGVGGLLYSSFEGEKANCFWRTEGVLEGDAFHVVELAEECCLVDVSVAEFAHLCSYAVVGYWSVNVVVGMGVGLLAFFIAVGVYEVSPFFGVFFWEDLCGYGTIGEVGFGEVECEYNGFSSEEIDSTVGYLACLLYVVAEIEGFAEVFEWMALTEVYLIEVYVCSVVEGHV